MINYLTFDCYDTLVAYSAGKERAIRELVREKGDGDADAAVEAFAQNEHAMHRAPDFQPIGVVLRECLRVALTAQGLSCSETDGDRIVQAVCDARPFDDVLPSLERLHRHYKLAILSNSEQAIIKHNVARIGATFDQVVLAEDARCYKPDHRMFQALLARCDCAPEEIVHIAQGFYHDIIPGHALGLRRVWINRNGLEGDETYGPYDELPDLSGLAALLSLS